ncbi:PQQ-dependent sugar dehydrogenase [Kibdelosporangium philippinense]|uniref:PQQ-dependent sugar dehydrogenase n=1 Tax=Kibdelosporangium philippinense TaxID=211113 RepID=A0ABS8ZSV6_9PSEU|nr:PQQ-dependent sugar dehydrogenase [Kibdelosporangium philippinense]MCE7010815.1 PQQ-dependent sugar dehydrogenase [Kibdelosporangium philippinense]
MSRPPLRRALSCVLSAVAIGTLWPAVPASSTEQRGVPLSQLRVVNTEIAAGLDRPTAIAALPDGGLLINEKRGTIRAYNPRTGLATRPVLDIRDRVSETENERGLLGLAIPADHARSKVIYVAYTRKSDEAVTLSRFRLDTRREEVLLAQDHSEFGNHNGGNIAFGSDGFLYFGIGDGGSGGDPLGTGQNLNTLLGKILRLDVSRTCGALKYCVPRDNPFVGVPGTKAEIWSWGLRNPWRFSFDRANGSLWIGDVGQGRFEEVDHIGARQGGVNFGWSCMEGPNVFDQTRCDPNAKYTAPVFHYLSGTEGCAVIGGHVYRGSRFAGLAGGTYVATDYCSGTAFGIRANADGTHTSATIGTFPTDVSALGVDVNGELFMVDDIPGRLHKLTFERVR